MSFEVENELLYQSLQRGRYVEARIGAVEKLDEQTWILAFDDYPSFKGLVPLSEAEVSEKLMYAMIGQKIAVIPKGIEKNIVACSRIELIEKVQDKVISKLELNQIIPVVIVAVIYKEQRPVLVVDVGQGVFVEIPRSKATICYCKPLRDQFKGGQVINCQVMSFEPLMLSIRDAQSDPWLKADFRRNSIISGTVYAVQNEKVFVEPDLQSGILGLAPVPLLGEVQKGTRVRCKVRYFDPEKKKLHLYLLGII